MSSPDDHARAPAESAPGSMRSDAAASPPDLADEDDEADEADESLMLRYAAGDIAAFDTLYGRHEMGVWRYVLRSVREPAVADDLMQDVWFSVARQAGNYRPTARFKTWLFTMAHHRMVDHFRTAKHHQSLDGDDAQGGPGEAVALADTLAQDSGFGPVAQLHSRQQAMALVAAVGQLPQEQREAFLLQAEGEMSVDAIAQATGVNFETAKSRLRYARNSLRRWLKEFA